MAKKLTYEEVKNYIETQSDCKLLSKEYINNNTKMLFQCKCGNFFETTLTRFKGNKNYTGKRQCDKCGQKRSNDAKRLSYDYVKDYIETNSQCKLISNKYINCKQKLELLCSCGKKFQTTWTDIQTFNKLQCNDCGRKIMISKQRKTHSEFIKEIYNIVGNEYIVLDTYINNKTKIKIKHNKCGHIFLMKPSNFLSGQRCPKCFGANPYTTEEFKKIIYEKTNGEYELVGEYKKSRIKTEILHKKCGNTYMVSPNNFLRGKRCPYCSEIRNSNLSKLVKKYFTRNNIKYKTEYIFKDCKYIDPLRFDFYLIERNIVIEVDGKQHFEPVDFFGGEKAFKLQQIKDNIKNTYCLKNNIPLIRIPYWEEDNINEILDKVLLGNDNTYFIA